MEKIVGVAQLYFMPHPLLEIVQRLMAHPVYNDFVYIEDICTVLGICQTIPLVKFSE